MSDLPELPDLKFLPDWLKESEAAGNRYANYEGEPERSDRFERPGGRGREGREGRGPGGPGGPRPGNRGPRPGGGPPGNRGPRPGGPRSDRGPRPGGPGGDRGPRPGGSMGRRDDRGERRGPHRGDVPPEYQQVAPAAVRVEFLPEPAAVVAVAKQIKSTHRAFPLFGTGRLFLERTERHRVRLTSLKPDAPLYQVADGPIALERSLVDRDAFRVLKNKYYIEETQQGDPPKGNFSNVARLRSSGFLIGPTNYHSYQPSLRRIYEERYSRRMSFAEFQNREIVVVNDEQSINDWKEQARTTVTWTTTQEAEPRTFKSLAEVEAHFRQNYLAAEIKCAQTLEANGAAMRTSPDRALIAAIRETIEKERAFPAGIVNAMRPILTDAGLHFFKHRKRVVFVSTIRPLPHPVGQPAKESVSKIISIIAASPRCTRHDLAVKMIGKDFESPEKAEEKTALAADLHYLLLAGHVIEFTDGKFDLPLQPKALAAETEAHPAEGVEVHAETVAPAAESSPTPEYSAAPIQPEEAGSPRAEVPAPEIAPLAEARAEAASTRASEPVVPDDQSLATPAESVVAEPTPPREPESSSATAVVPAECEAVPELVATGGDIVPPPVEMIETDTPIRQD